jgi:signal transduction histidine kinase
MNDSAAARDPALYDPAGTMTNGVPLRTSWARRESTDARLFAAMRLILAISGLAIIYVDPEPRTREAVTYGALLAYCGYAAGVLVYGARSGWRTDQRWLCAVDVLFAFVLILWTAGTQSIFFYVLLFPVLVVSFSHGYRDGLLFTFASLAVFMAAAALVKEPIAHNELMGLLIRRPVYLLGFGYMVARWGGREILFKRRLMLLREVNSATARAEVEEVIALNLARIRELHSAQRCLLVLRQGVGPDHLVFASARDDRSTASAREMDAATAEMLLRIRDGVSTLYSTRRFLGAVVGRACVAYDSHGDRSAAIALSDCESVANLLDARHMASVPYRQSDGTGGRLFLTSDRRAFTRDDLEFLEQFSMAVAKVAEGLRLVDELISSAAEHERALISRDIHDAAVQPYIGLRLGLEALYRHANGSVLEPRILDLIDMANATVRDLRGYTRGLLSGEVPGGSLRAAILMQGERHKRFYALDIETRVDDASGDLQGRFAAHVFYIVVEALANVVKHTAARRAFVEVRTIGETVHLRVGNEHSTGANESHEFVPKSIKSRVEELGGALAVEHTAEAYTVVHASFPIH